MLAVYSLYYADKWDDYIISNEYTDKIGECDSNQKTLAYILM
jgi:hypothetical protein